MINNRFFTILCKEIVDNLRDRRTLTTITFSVVISPLLLIAMLWFIESSVKEETDPVTAKAIELPVIGAERAPNLIAYLKQNNFAILPAPSNPEATIKSGKQRMVLEIPTTFALAFEKGQPASLRLIHDSSISGLERIGVDSLRNAVARYGSIVGALRLEARGVSSNIVTPFVVNMTDVASPEARNSELTGMLPYLIILFVVIGGMYLAIDATAGERENGSLEPLLCQPVERQTILLAKMAATAFYSAMTLALVLVGLALSFHFITIEMMTLKLSVGKVMWIFLWALPFVVLASALLVLVASFTKSYKEAQSYVGFATLVPSFPLVMLTILSPQPSVSNMWIPSFSQGLMVVETMKGEIIALPLLLLSASTSLVLAAVLAFIAIKLYQREGILG